MGSDSVIRICHADHGSHPEALSLNSSFRADVPVLKLGVKIAWTPPRPMAALFALEAGLVELCPSLQAHECRGQAEYHVLRFIDGEERRPDEGATAIEPGLALAHLFEHVVIDSIAFITDAPVISGATGALRGTATRFDIFVECPDSAAAELSVELARNWIDALVAGQDPGSQGRLTLKLARYLYCTEDTAEASEIARHLGLERGAVCQGLEWLELVGLTRRVDYGMNFSGSSYYGLRSSDETTVEESLARQLLPERQAPVRVVHAELDVGDAVHGDSHGLAGSFAGVSPAGV